MALAVLLGLSYACGVAAAEPSADDILREAIQLLNSRKDALHSSAEQKRIDDAVDALLERIDRGASTIPPAGGLPLSTMMIRKKLRAKAAYNAKTGELSLGYDFLNRAQLQDFDCEKAHPVTAHGMLALNAGDSIVHVVKFKTLSLAAIVSLRQMKGQLAATSGGVSIDLGDPAPDTLYLNTVGEDAVQMLVADKERSGVLPFGLQIEDRRLIVYWGTGKLGKPISEPRAGRVEFHGGAKGFAFGNLNLRGQLDEEWAREFFGLSK
jgi:hypothetical protein